MKFKSSFIMLINLYNFMYFCFNYFFIQDSQSSLTFTSIYCIALHCIALYCIVLHCIVLHCIALYCIVLHCIVLHCIALYCIEVEPMIRDGYMKIVPPPSPQNIYFLFFIYLLYIYTIFIY